MSLQPEWRVHTARILEEVLSNKGTWALRIPLLTLDNLLRQVAVRAIELDDPALNKLMVRLTLYSVGDPYSPDFDQSVITAMMESDIK